MDSNESQIANFYKNQTIFITGGTGLVGKLVIEKLLRVCGDLKKIFVLIRNKQNKTAQERFSEFFTNPCFDLIKDQNLLNKVHVINGDCSKPLLGLSSQDIILLKIETTCVIHAAANVKFNWNLKEGSYNLTSTRDLLELAKEMTQLKVFLYVSTFASNINKKILEEIFYDPPITPDTLLNLVKFDDKTLSKISPVILAEWPNAYAYTKCITEAYIKNANVKFPVVIVRPSAIGSTISEPFTGWTDNIMGYTGVIFGFFLGVIRCVETQNNSNIYIVPADYVANLIVASVWKTAITSSDNIQIYNCVGNVEKLTKLYPLLNKFYWNCASVKFLWYKSIYFTESQFLFNFWNTMYIRSSSCLQFFLSLIDRRSRFLDTFIKLNQNIHFVCKFMVQNFNCDSSNVVKLWNELNVMDQKLFKFYSDSIDWNDYLEKSCYGVRVYLLKDPTYTIPEGKKHVKKLFVLYYLSMTLLWIAVIFLAKWIIGFFF